MILCNECGNELNNTAKFCKKCGTKVNQDNVNAVENSGSAVVENRDVEQKNTVSTDEASEVEISTLDVDTIESYFFDYIDFLKETLIHPSSVFKAEPMNWIFGAISLTLFAVVFSFYGYYEFLPVFIKTVVFQATFVGLLFILNKFLLGGSDTFLTALGKYGGLMNSQIILFLVMVFLGMDSGFGIFVGLIAMANQLNIFNLYVLNSQSKVNHRLDKYYQLLVSYIPLVYMIYYMFGDIVTSW